MPESLGWPPFTGKVSRVKVKGAKVTFEVTYSRGGSTAHHQLTMEGDRLTGWGKNYQSGNIFTVNLERKAKTQEVPIKER